MSRKMAADIVKILQVSRHAPSSHNTQPWKVVVDKDVIEVGFDPERQLHVGDPDKRELYISLGCFIESFVLAAEDLGYKTKFEFIGQEPQMVTRLRIEEADSTNTKHWAKLITQRHSDRRYYESKKIPVEVINSFDRISSKYATFHIFTEKIIVDFLASETYDATLSGMSDPKFRAELASWVRNNWTKKYDGMPAYVQGIPGPVSLIAKFVINKNKAVAKDQAKKDFQRMTHSAAVGLICVNEHVPRAWIEAGRLYQRACLLALKNNLKSAGASAAVIDPVTSKKIIKKLSLGSNPVALLRFGYLEKTTKASPRLTLAHFVTEK